MKLSLSFKKYPPVIWIIALCLSLGNVKVSALDTKSSLIATDTPLINAFQAEQGFPPEIAQYLEIYLKTVIGDGDRGGLVVRVDIGDASWRGAWGDANLNKCCRQENQRVFSNKFRIASISKVFTASVVLALVEQGHIELQDTLEKWFGDKPEYADWYAQLPSEKHFITVQQLLNMTAPLGNYVGSDEVQQSYACTPLRMFTPAELLKIGFQTSLPEPMPKVYYSNTNYILLGLLIEAVTQKSVEQNLQELIFKPLELSNTTFPVKSAIPYDYDAGYTIYKDTEEPQMGLSQVAWHNIQACAKNRTYPSMFPSISGYIVNEATFTSPTVPWTAGAIVSTMDDMLTAVKAQIKGQVPALSKTLQARYTNANQWDSQCGKDIFYGLGIMEYGNYKGHDGAVVGYNSAVFYDPEQEIAVGLNINMLPPAPYMLDAKSIAFNVINLIEKGVPCSP